MVSRHVREGKGTVPREAHEEGLRVAHVLAAKIQARGLSVRKVEELVGWGQGTLHLALAGRTPLRYSHAAAVCSALGISLAGFYRELASGLEAPPPRRAPKEVAPGLTDAELLDAVRDLILRHRLSGEDKE